MTGRTIKLAMAAAAAAALWAAAAHAEAPPRAVAATTKKDLGKVKAGGSASAKFIVKNEGQGALKLHDLHADCGCTTATFPDTIAPGKEGTVEAKFTAAPVWSGKLEKGFHIKTNDPKLKQLDFKLLVEVIPFVYMEPQSPLVLHLSPGETKKQDVKLTVRKGLSLKLSPPKAAVPFVKAKFEAGKAPGTYVVHLVVGPNPKPGDYQGMLLLPTTEPQLPSLPITVQVQAKTGPVVTPTEIVLPEQKLKGGGKKELARMQVLTRSGHINVKKVDTGNPGIKAEVLERLKQQYFEVVLTYTGGWKPGPIESKITITTDDPKYPTLVVPFRTSAR